MAKQPIISPLLNFEFSIKDFDFVADVEVYKDPISDTLVVWDIKLEHPELFNKEYIMEHLEHNLQDELQDEYND
jgi:hypothetical protein